MSGSTVHPMDATGRLAFKMPSSGCVAPRTILDNALTEMTSHGFLAEVIARRCPHGGASSEVPASRRLSGGACTTLSRSSVRSLRSFGTDAFSGKVVARRCPRGGACPDMPASKCLLRHARFHTQSIPDNAWTINHDGNEEVDENHYMIRVMIPRVTTTSFVMKAMPMMRDRNDALASKRLSKHAFCVGYPYPPKQCMCNESRR